MFGAPVPDDAIDQPPTVGDAEHVMGVLTALAEQRRAAVGTRAAPPVSTWHWPAFAAIIIPGLALVIAVLL